MYAFKKARRFTRPIDKFSKINANPDDNGNAQAELQTPRELNAILRSKSSKVLNIYAGHNFEVSCHSDHKKRRKWLSVKVVTFVNHSARTITVPGNTNSTTLDVSFENISMANPLNNFSQLTINPRNPLDSLLSGSADSVVGQDESIEHCSHYQSHKTMMMNLVTMKHLYFNLLQIIFPFTGKMTMHSNQKQFYTFTMMRVISKVISIVIKNVSKYKKKNGSSHYPFHHIHVVLLLLPLDHQVRLRRLPVKPFYKNHFNIF